MECQLDRITIHYESIGQGRPLVALSGSPGDSRIGRSWTEPVFEARPGWQRIYVDLPGTPRTPGRDWITCADDVMDVLCDFVDAVIPRQSFAVTGASLGAYFAHGMAYRKEAQVDGVCLLAPWLTPEDAQPLPEPVLFIEDPEIRSQLDPDDAEFFTELFVIETQKTLDWYQNVVIPAREGADRKFWPRVMENWRFSFDIDSLRFNKPALVIAGRQDTHTGYYDIQLIMECYQRGTFVVLDRAGHALGVEQEVLFRALFNEWLDRVVEGSSAS